MCSSFQNPFVSSSNGYEESTYQNQQTCNPNYDTGSVYFSQTYSAGTNNHPLHQHNTNVLQNNQYGVYQSDNTTYYHNYCNNNNNNNNNNSNNNNNTCSTTTTCLCCYEQPQQSQTQQVSSLQYGSNAFSDSYDTISCNQLQYENNNQIQYNNQTINLQSLNMVNNQCCNTSNPSIASYMDTSSQFCSIQPQLRDNIVYNQTNCNNIHIHNNCIDNHNSNPFSNQVIVNRYIQNGNNNNNTQRFINRNNMNTQQKITNPFTNVYNNTEQITMNSNTKQLQLINNDNNTEQSVINSVNQEIKVTNKDNNSIITPSKMKHKKDKTSEKPFVCEICGKGYKYLCNYRSHCKIHTDDAFVCKFCNKRFGRKSNYNEHVRIHTGEAPYKCTFCNKTFKQHHGWKDHLRVHTGEKPYLCQYCGKRFTVGHNLNVHMRIHTGERPFACHICKKAYRQKSAYNSHARNVHGIIIKPKNKKTKY